MHWHLRSWQNAIQKQQPDYPDQAALDKVLARLSELPPLVTPEEVDLLKQQLAEAAEGKRFILQAGDCAESFEKCSAEAINKQVKILQQMSLVLMHGFSTPVTTIGRIAGQYAKPRSSATETRNNVTLPSYRGDLINGQEFTAQSRRPEPQRLLQGYGFASMTLNYIRSLKKNTLSELKSAEAWQEPLLDKDPLAKERLSHIGKSINFLDQIKQSPISSELFTSHEALHLDYEQALTRQHQGQWYNLSTHFPWVGMRTAQPNSAHVEYLRGIQNPIAIKVGPSIDGDELLSLINTLNPACEPGKITLITRFGVNNLNQYLPPLIRKINESNQRVLWSCDPMHGNSRMTVDGYKTRDIEAIQKELAMTFQLHQQNGSNLGAVHLEVSGENVSECCGGVCQLNDAMLEHNYQSLLDPRLNRTQALAMTLFITHEISRQLKTPLHLASSGD